MKPHCEFAFDHEPGEICKHCNLEVNKYGNTEEDFRNCSFPDCGCDGARLCMAGEANADAQKCNVEGMYQRKDMQAKLAVAELIMLSAKRNKTT